MLSQLLISHRPIDPLPIVRHLGISIGILRPTGSLHKIGHPNLASLEHRRTTGIPVASSVPNLFVEADQPLPVLPARLLRVHQHPVELEQLGEVTILGTTVPGNDHHGVLGQIIALVQRDRLAQLVVLDRLAQLDQRDVVLEVPVRFVREDRFRLEAAATLNQVLGTYKDGEVRGNPRRE